MTKTKQHKVIFHDGVYQRYKVLHIDGFYSKRDDKEPFVVIQSNYHGLREIAFNEFRGMSDVEKCLGAKTIAVFKVTPKQTA